MHDIDDSLPPNVTYTDTSSACGLSASEGEEEEGEGDESGSVEYTPSAGASKQQLMDWEQLDPSTEETRLFEEEQMRLALDARPMSTDDGQTLAHVHAQEVEIYRQRLRRLDYNSTYMDYAALAATAGNPDSQHSHLSGSGADLSLGGSEDGGKRGSSQEEVGGATASNPQQTLTSAVLGTLSSLWTSTFGGSTS